MKAMYKLLIIAALLLFLLVAGPSPGEPALPAAKADPAKLVAVLTSDAPLKAKADACRQLAVVGTRDAVPALAALLSDDKLAHMARYALEPIADPSVDAALREALGKLKGRPLVGVIASIGVRRHASAVKPLAARLNDVDADVAQAAARALGRIGTADAAAALARALDGAPAGQQRAVAAALLRCAEAAADRNRRDEAEAIYDRLLGLKALPEIRVCALRGAVLVRGKEGLPLLQQHLRGDGRVLFAAALRTVQELPDAQRTEVLTKALGQVSADQRIVVIQSLGPRADERALAALLAAARTDLAPGQRVELCGQALTLVKSTAQKKQLLAALGGIPSADAITLAVPYLDEAATREEAGVAVVSAAEQLLKAKDVGKAAGALIEPLQRVAQAPASPEVTRRAQAALQQAQEAQKEVRKK
jgi:HEAT repeat protein